MADSFDTPPTEDEIAAAGWDTPPTPEEEAEAWGPPPTAQELDHVTPVARAGEAYLADKKVSPVLRFLREAWAASDVWSSIPDVSENPFSAPGQVPTTGEIEGRMATAVEEANRPRPTLYQKSELADEPGAFRPSVLIDATTRQFRRQALNHRRALGILYDARASASPAWSKLAADNTADITTIETELGPEQDYQQSAVEQLALDAIEIGTSSLPSMAAKLGTQAAGAVAGAAVGALGGGAGAVPAAIVGWRMASIPGSVAAAVAGFDQEAGSAYGEFLRMTEDDGTPIDPEVARGAAVVYGVMASVVEVMQLAPRFARFGPLGDAIRKGEGIVAARELLRDQATRGIFREVMKNAAKNNAIETTEELLQETLNVLVGEGARGVSAGEMQDVDWPEIRERLAETGIKTVTGIAAGTGAVGAATHAASLRIEQVKQAAQERLEQRGAEKVRAVVEIAGSPTAMNLPEQLAKAVESASEADGLPVTHVYGDPDLLRAKFAELGLDPSTVLGPEAAQRLQDAQLQRMDEPGQRNTLEIDLATFGRFPEALARALAEDLAVRPGHRTARELAAGAGQAEAQAAEAAKEETRQQSLEPASLPSMRERFEGLRDDIDRAAEVFRDPVTGLRNEAGMAEAPPDAKRGHLAVFDIEGAKLINDQLGHDALDDAYRAMAAAMRSAGIADGGKVKGSLVAWVRNEAEAQKLAEAMRTAVDPRLQVTAAAAERGRDFGATKEAAFKAVGEAKAALRSQVDDKGAPRLGDRKGVPAAFLGPTGLWARLTGQPAPQIAWEAGMPGLPSDSPEAKALVGRATSELAPLAERLKGTPQVPGAEITPDHLTAFSRRSDTAFADHHLTPGGLLSHAGRLRAMEVNPKRWVASADLRAFKDIDATFVDPGSDLKRGEAADAINEEFERIVRDVGGGRYDAWHQSGDEYGAHANSREELEAFFGDLQEVASNHVFVFKRLDGSIIAVHGLSFAAGIAEGDTPAAAFRQADHVELKKAKEAQDARKEVAAPRTFRDRSEYEAALGSGWARGARQVDVSKLIRQRRDEAESREASRGIETAPEQTSLRWLLKRWADLRFRAGATGTTPIEAVKAAAATLVGRMNVRRLSPGAMANRERAAAKLTAVYTAEGNFTAAYQSVKAQVLARYQSVELARAVEDRGRFEALLAQQVTQTRRETMGKAGIEYLAASDQILEALGAPVPQGDTDRPDLAAALYTLKGTDQGVAFDVDRIRQTVAAANGDWRSLTVADVRFLRDALTTLYHQAREMVTIEIEGKRVEISEAVATIASEAAVRPDLGTQDKPSRWAGIRAMRMAPQTTLRKLGDTGYRLLWGGLIDAEAREDAVLRKVGEWFAKQWDELPAEMRKRRYDPVTLPEGMKWPDDVDRKPVLDRQFMWMVALNMGNASNRERLLGGYRWDEQATLRWLRDTMSREEWRFVESTWQLLDRELWPQVAETFRAARGISPPKIEATPITLPDGTTVSGGYFPARYDPIASRVGQQQSVVDLEKNYNQKAGAISVGKSFTKERAKHYNDVVNLDWSVVPSHVVSVAHYIAFDPYVRRANAIMRQARFQKTVRHRIGAKDLEHLAGPDGFLAMASSSALDAVPSTLQDMYWYLRLGKGMLVTAAIGWSVKTTLADYADPLKRAFAAPQTRIRADYVLGSMIKAYSGAGFFGMRRRAMALSPHEVRHRAENTAREIRQQLEEVGEQGRRSRAMQLLNLAQNTAGVFQEVSDRVVTTVVWDAAFRQEMGRGATEKEAARKADDVVQASMPVMDPHRKPSLLRDRRGLAQILLFYGYQSQLTNDLAEVLDPFLVRWGNAEGFGAKVRTLPTGTAAWAVGGVLGIASVATLLGELVSGRGPEEDEENEQWALRKMLALAFNRFPVAGELGEEMVNRSVSYAFEGEFSRRPLSVRGAPTGSGFKRLLDAAVKAIDSDDDTAAGQVLDWIEAASVMVRLPPGSSAFARFRSYVEEEFEQDLGEGDAPGLIKGPVFGPEDRP